MGSCAISYIPVHLHASGRPDLPVFEVGERLFRRCPESGQEKPFSAISLVDISVNREGPAALAPLCYRDDVLFNFNPTEKQPGQRIAGQVAVELVFKELVPHGSYEKASTEPTAVNTEAPVFTCIIRLLHKQEECNYAHCAFEMRLDGEEVTYANYKQSLGAKGPAFSKLRDWCRQELGKMYVRQEVKEEVRLMQGPETGVS